MLGWLGALGTQQAQAWAGVGRRGRRRACRALGVGHRRAWLACGRARRFAGVRGRARTGAGRTGSRRGRAAGRAGGRRAAGRRAARGVRAAWAPGLALGSALGALGPFSIRFDSFFFLSHQINTVHCKIKFFRKKLCV